MELVGIDIGGTGIKGAPADIGRGTLTAERVRIPTPQPATPDAVSEVVAEVVARFETAGVVGATFPAVIQGGKARTAANVDQAWIGEDVGARLGAASGRTFVVLNDADAAGLAEVRFGAGAGRSGVVILVTLGTGIGSALFIDGTLVPNTELGHLQFHKRDAEQYAADSVRERKELSWKAWGKRVGAYLGHVEKLFSPDLFIIGGGVSKKADRYFKYFDTTAEVVPAQLLNEAGIVGAALAAAGTQVPSTVTTHAPAAQGLSGSPEG